MSAATRTETWCEEAGCPRHMCVACEAAAHDHDPLAVEAAQLLDREYLGRGFDGLVQGVEAVIRLLEERRS